MTGHGRGGGIDRDMALIAAGGVVDGVEGSMDGRGGGGMEDGVEGSMDGLRVGIMTVILSCNMDDSIDSSSCF